MQYHGLAGSCRGTPLGVMNERRSMQDPLEMNPIFQTVMRAVTIGLPDLIVRVSLDPGTLVDQLNELMKDRAIVVSGRRGTTDISKQLANMVADTKMDDPADWRRKFLHSVAADPKTESVYISLSQEGHQKFRRSS